MKENYEKRKFAMQLYPKGNLTITQIAEIVGASRKTVGNWKKQNFGNVRSLKRERVKKMFLDGYAISEMANILNTTQTTVKRFINELPKEQQAVKPENTGYWKDYKTHIAALKKQLTAAAKAKNINDIATLSDAIVKLEKANLYAKESENRINSVSNETV